MLLTNKHVLYDGTQDSTTEAQTIGQPSVSNVCCCSCNDIGTSVIGINDTNVDCALAKLNSDEVPSLLIQNDTAGVEIHVSGTASAVMGETVRKIGARSAFTTGVVVEVSGPSNTSYNTDSGDTVTIHRSNEIIVRAADAETYVIENGKASFSNHGDSGSVVVNDANQVIGLLYGVGNPGNATIFTMVSHISSVLSALSSAGQAITLSVTPGGGSADDYGIAPPAQAALTGTRLDDVLLRVLGDDVETHPFIQAAQTHFDEMLDLVNHSRPVTVAWHRKQGPAFLAAFMRSAKEPNYRIPQEIEGITRQHALTTMITVFEEHGSEALKAAIERYGLEVLFACSRYDTVDEIVQALYDSQAARV